MGVDLDERVVEHEGRAGSAKLLVERNPFIHFGLDVQLFAENNSPGWRKMPSLG